MQNGSNKAFASIYEHYWAKVYNFCELYLTDRETINDCVQDVFIRIWNSRHSLDENKNLEGYIFITVRNMIFDHFNKRVNFRTVDITAIATLADNLNGENILIEKEIKEAIDHIISKLPPRQQEAFNLSRYERLSYKEIAEIMKISDRTVEKHVSEALKYIKSNLKDTFILLPYIIVQLNIY